MEKIEVGFHEVNPTYKIGDRAATMDREALTIHIPNDPAKIEGSCHQVQPVARTLDIYGF
jgi:hypothetical protein